MASNNNFNGQDIREAMQMASTDMDAVGDEMTRLARESRIKVLEGDQRKEFMRGMSQSEFDILHDVAMSMGPNGLVALERLMQEAGDQWKQERHADA